MPESDESLGGYPKVAAFMGLKPGFNIFRRFGALNARNLLYMQAELNELELELQEIAIEDATCEDPKRLLYATRWRDLNEGRDDVQWKMVLRIRERLKEYNAALLQAKQLYQIDRPTDHDLDFFRLWLQRPKGGDCFLRGCESRVWSTSNSADLVVLSSRGGEQDLFTRWIADTVISVFHRYIGNWIFTRFPKLIKPRTGDVEAGIFDYKDEKIVAVVSAFGTILSSLFPVGSIFALYFIRDTLQRLAAIACFMTLFSAILAILTDARRVDIFAATAAFASVQVVFVGFN